MRLRRGGHQFQVQSSGWAAKLAALGGLCAFALAGCGQTEGNDQAAHERAGAPAASGDSSLTNGGSSSDGGSPSASGASAGSAAAGKPSGLGAAGQPADAQPWPSAGCRKVARPDPGTPPAIASSVHLSGATLDPSYQAVAHDRGYTVQLPFGYDPARPYRTVFVTAPTCGGGPGDRRFDAVAGADHDSIYVSLFAPPSVINELGCADNTGTKSTEWEYFALVAQQVENDFCVDKNDELVAGGGQSGGTVVNMLGCYFAAVDPTRRFGPDLSLRGQLSIVAALPLELPTCNAPIAALFMHDMLEFVPISESSASLERVLSLDGCASDTTAWGTDQLSNVGCKKYACPSNTPVIFCATTSMGRQGNYYNISGPTLAQFLAEVEAGR